MIAGQKLGTEIGKKVIENLKKMVLENLFENKKKLF
jgi:hypothetical protein